MLSSVFKNSGLPQQPATVRDCIDWLTAQFGFDPNHSEQFILHDLMHILGDAISGTVLDERRAAIMEHHMLSTCLVNSTIVDDRVVSNGPRFEMEDLADNYAANGRLAILEKVRAETLSIVEKIVGHKTDEFFVPDTTQRDEIEKQLSESGTIKNLRLLLEPSALTWREQQDVICRAQAIDLYFRQNNEGRKLDTFKIQEILAMPIGAFGIIPSETNGRIRFETPLAASPGVFAHDFNF